MLSSKLITFALLRGILWGLKKPKPGPFVIMMEKEMKAAYMDMVRDIRRQEYGGSFPETVPIRGMYNVVTYTNLGGVCEPSDTQPL